MGKTVEMKLCRLCSNALLTHGARVIGVCHECIMKEKTNKGIPIPGYWRDHATEETTRRG